MGHAHLHQHFNAQFVHIGENGTFGEKKLHTLVENWHILVNINE